MFQQHDFRYFEAEKEAFNGLRNIPVSSDVSVVGTVIRLRFPRTTRVSKSHRFR